MSARPVLVVTNLVAPDRVGAFAALHAAEGIELALFGGRSQHGTDAVTDPGVPHRQVRQRDVLGLAASGAFRAVVAGTAGRVALPAAALGARRARVPFLLWTALWAHPGSLAFRVAGAPLLEVLYRRAAAVVTYGPHVSAFVRAHGARRVFEAPQAVDGAFWAGPAQPERPAPFTALHVGRPARSKGLPELLAAWEVSGLAAEGAALVLLGGAGRGGGALPPGALAVGARPPHDVRNFLAGAAVLVMPSVPTRDFREPWGLVANEAMHRSVPVLATDAVGAAAGGLVRDGRNGLVVPTGDPGALAAALRRLHDDPALRARLGAQAAHDVAAHTYAAWAAGFSAALAAAGAPHPHGEDR